MHHLSCNEELLSNHVMDLRRTKLIIKKIEDIIRAGEAWMTEEEPESGVERSDALEGVFR